MHYLGLIVLGRIVVDAVDALRAFFSKGKAIR